MRFEDLLKRLALLVPAVRRLRRARDALLRERDAVSRELSRTAARLRQVEAGAASPFHHFHAVFDARDAMRRHAVAGIAPSAGHLTNFLGVRIDPKFFPDILRGRAGEVEPVPIPANWHSDIAEWGAALRAVDLARGRFVAVELGCGWGCWLNNAGAAARRRGLEVELIGVEGDEGHLGFAREARAANGFDEARVTLHHGIAAASSGVALFPRQGAAGGSWGLEPVLDADRARRDAAARAGSHDEVPMMTLAQIVGDRRRIDLLHMDIQGGEADLVASALPLLRERVAFVVVGTHSRAIEGRLFDLLLGEGWRLEIERPCILRLEPPAPFTAVDGVQGWRNPRLLPPDRG